MQFQLSEAHLEAVLQALDSKILYDKQVRELDTAVCEQLRETLRTQAKIPARKPARSAGLPTAAAKLRFEVPEDWTQLIVEALRQRETYLHLVEDACCQAIIASLLQDYDAHMQSMGRKPAAREEVDEPAIHHKLG
jgi:hypothetical protein